MFFQYGGNLVMMQINSRFGDHHCNLFEALLEAFLQPFLGASRDLDACPAPSLWRKAAKSTAVF
jgi:hypothetical protein